MSDLRRSGTAQTTTSFTHGIERSSTSASAQTVSSAAANYPTQIISDRYMDPDKLKDFLDKTFPGQYKAQVTRRPFAYPSLRRRLTCRVIR
jgi:hypothetical protein